MADIDAVQDSLLDAIDKLAKDAMQLSPNSQVGAERISSAARQLAEAHAWLERPGQDHGGNAAAATS